MPRGTVKSRKDETPDGPQEVYLIYDGKAHIRPIPELRAHAPIPLSGD